MPVSEEVPSIRVAWVVVRRARAVVRVWRYIVEGVLVVGFWVCGV